jgi:hypothetical protein
MHSTLPRFRDGGPGRWCWWSARRSGVGGCRDSGPETLAMLSASASCRVGDKVALDVVSLALSWSVGVFIFVGVSRVAPPIAVTSSSLRLWCDVSWSS